MALTKLNEKLNTYRDTAATIRATQARDIEQIRTNPMLSADGKTAAIAKIHGENAQRIKDLEASERTALTEQRLELERSLFGQFDTEPAAVLNYRDAQERVARLTPDDHPAARQLLHTAQISGDTTLAAALLGKALSSGWSDIITSYSEQHPEKAVQLRDLSDVIHFQEDHEIDFQRSADYSFQKPQEIAHYTDNTIDRIADTEAAAPSAPTEVGMRDLERWAVDNG